ESTRHRRLEVLGRQAAAEQHERHAHALADLLRQRKKEQLLERIVADRAPPEHPQRNAVQPAVLDLDHLLERSFAAKQVERRAARKASGQLDGIDAGALEGTADADRVFELEPAAEAVA